MTVACQIAGDDPERLYDILRRNSQLPEEFMDLELDQLTDKQLEQLNERIENVKNWLRLYAPDFVKFQVQEELPQVELSEPQVKFLQEVADLIESREMTAEELHDEMYSILRRHGLKPQKAFQAIYRILIGKKMGPRAASFLLSLERDFVIRRLRMEADMKVRIVEREVMDPWQIPAWMRCRSTGWVMLGQFHSLTTPNQGPGQYWRLLSPPLKV